MQVLKKGYQCIIGSFVIWILYSTFYFGYMTDKESAKWGITGGKLIGVYKFYRKDLKKLVDESNKNLKSVLITPELSTGNGGKLVTFVDMYAKTSSYSTKVMWITWGEKKCKRKNMRITFFPYIKGRYTFVINGDVKELKFSPQEVSNKKTFIITKLIIEKYRMK